jgi:addiction module HigA family antidote
MAAIHPGELIAPLVLEPSGISQSELARRMGFNQPQPVNELVNGKRGFTPKMALLFEQVTEGAFPAVFWLVAQAVHDSDVARRGMSAGRRAAVDPITLAEPIHALAGRAGVEDLLAMTEQLSHRPATRS